MKYDVIIVGSGPAGSVTARYAAQSGAKVLIIDRRPEIGVPVLCGEGISQRVDNWKMLEGKRWIAGKMDGAKIYSPDGTVVTLSKEMAGNETGYVVYIQHGSDLISVYKHNAELLKNTGDRVNAGEAIAIIGNSGEITTGPHLHFELWYNGTALNPEQYIDL